MYYMKVQVKVDCGLACTYTYMYVHVLCGGTDVWCVLVVTKYWASFSEGKGARMGKL